MRRNRHFLKKIKVKAVFSVEQPAQAPPRPDTPQYCAFPVQANWFKMPSSEMRDEKIETVDKTNHLQRNQIQNRNK
jgi:hypothetical protein